MFGQNDDNQGGAQLPGPQDDTLNGVTDLVGGSVAPPPASEPPAAEPTTFMPSTPADEGDQPAHHDDSPAADASTTAPMSMSDGGNDDLLELKQQALQQLTPLVGHLDQSPEEKFRTTMMLIQASDNQSLLKEAYEAANQIPDEKSKAQALLDVINEINYFTQKTENKQ